MIDSKVNFSFTSDAELWCKELVTQIYSDLCRFIEIITCAEQIDFLFK